MASADLPRVLRIPRIVSAEDHDYILLHVSPTGRHVLDLKLIGTDNEAAFSVKIKHKRTTDLKAKNFSGTQSQWEETLAAVLLGAGRTEFTQGVEAVAEVQAETSIIITIQRSIEGIKQKYGTITLAYTEEMINLFDWCALTIQSRETSSGGLAGLQEQLKEKDDKVKGLNDKLEELVTAKQAYEDELVEKFSILLNEKKLKIRYQQRLLSGARVDPQKLQEVDQVRVDDKASPPGPSRKRKRKAAVKDETDDETDDGFDKMEVDAEVRVEPEVDSNSGPEDERQTEDESTANENSDDEPPAKQLPTRNTNVARASGSGVSANQEVTIPPKRDLPFAKKPAAPAKLVTPIVEGSETESDDEL